MTTSPGAAADAAARIHPRTSLGAVHYTVADLSRQVEFYQSALGFRLHWREGAEAALGGGGADLLRLTEVRGARQVRGTTGLYHTAFLAPARRELSQMLLRLAQTRTPVAGWSDHYTHLAIYLPDAEGNGIELAWDFPREKWEPLLDEVRREGAEAMMRRGGQFDPNALIAELGDDPPAWDGIGPDTLVGHVHLHVADLRATAQFYAAALGFEQLFSSNRMRAAFFSAGGYHHHIGTNLWNGAGAPPPPADATGLRFFTVNLPDGDELERVLARAARAGIAVAMTQQGALLRDPAQNGVLLTAAG